MSNHIFLLSFLCFSCFASPKKKNEPSLVEQRFGKAQKYTVCGKIVSLYIADTHEKRSQGYMKLPEPNETEGILFKFDSQRTLSFWMKNVPFDLDILYFSKEKTFISALTMKGTSPMVLESQLASYSSLKPATYAIELKKGSLLELKPKVDCTFKKE